MLKAVTNRPFPMLERILRELFGIELEYDAAIGALGRLSIRDVIGASMSRDPGGRIRIVFIENVEDLSRGRFANTDVIGFNMKRPRLIFVAVPPEVEAIVPDCAYAPRSMEGYLLAVTLHELYENLTGDMSHCHNPGTCINSICRHYDNGTCCVCMGGKIDEKYPDLRLEDLYCEEDLAELREALARE